MAIFTRETLQAFAPRPAGKGERAQNWEAYVAALIDHGDEYCREFGIDEASELQHFMAQIGHECDGFQIFREDMRYSAQRILEIFGRKHSARVTPQEAAKLAGKPEALAERVYGLGNPRKARELGNTEPGDGYKYRGTGPMQVTGKADAMKYMNGELTHEASLRASFMEWDAKDLNPLARAGDIKRITKKINGGYNGFEDRKVWLAKAKRVWRKFPTQEPVVPPTPKQLAEVSTKAEIVKNLVATAQVGAGTATVIEAAEPLAQATSHIEGINAFTSAFATLAGFIKSHALLAIILMCLLGVYFGRKLLIKMIADYTEGRATPSGGDVKTKEVQT